MAQILLTYGENDVILIMRNCILTWRYFNARI